MIMITEKLNGNEFFYEMQVKKDKKTVTTTHLKFKSFIRDYDGKQYIIIYRPDMSPISEAFGFLNFYSQNKPINSKIKDMTALKLLYTYENIINKKLKEFSPSDIEGFKLFISGNLDTGQNYKFKLLTSRSNATINNYLATYRKYMKYLGEENKYLIDKTESVGFINPDTEGFTSSEIYTSNMKIPRKTVEVPRYISIQDFSKIIMEIRKNYSTREEAIVRLMFENGLRLGEVLGLTFDDVIMEKVEYPKNSGRYKILPVIYIRNRVSDKPYQKAKKLMNVKDKREYNLPKYRIQDYAYNKIVITRELYDLINDYIDKYHAIARDKKEENYYKYSKADRVSSASEFEEDNFYIFINSLGRTLSQTLWNNTIRKIFKAVNIEVDIDVKSHNLNHRFRHGFAMFNVKRGVKQIELMHMLRHSCLQSVVKYYRPTISDSIEIKEEFTEDLYTYIPALRRVI